MTYSHLIAVDPASGSLWGAVPIAAGKDALRADVIANVSPTGIMEAGDDGEWVPVTGAMLADRCGNAKSNAVVAAGKVREPAEEVAE